MRRLYCMTLQMPEMDSEGQIAPTRVSLEISACQSESFIEIFKISQAIRELYFVTKNWVPSSFIVLTKLSHKFSQN